MKQNGRVYTRKDGRSALFSQLVLHTYNAKVGLFRESKIRNVLQTTLVDTVKDLFQGFLLQSYWLCKYSSTVIP